MPKHDRTNIDKREKRVLRRGRDLDNFFDKAFVLSSENSGEFKALNHALKSELPQLTVMDKYNANRIANSIWHVQRTRRLQAAVIEGARVKALIGLLKPKYWKYPERKKRFRLAVNYFSNSDEERTKATRTVEKLGITRDMIEAHALELQGATVLILEKMQARNEQSIEQAEKKLMKSARSGKGKARRGGAADRVPAGQERGDARSSSTRPKNAWN
jgi:hypothetical protein